MLVSYMDEVVNTDNVFRFYKGSTSNFDYYIRFYRDNNTYTTFSFGDDKGLWDKVYNEILGNSYGGCLRYQKKEELKVEQPIVEQPMVTMESVSKTSDIMNNFYTK